MSIPELLAYSAGLVTAFNPCGIALLPSYLLYLLSGRVQKNHWQWVNGMVAGVLTTLGMVVVFGVASLVLSALGHRLFEAVPIFSLFMAMLLVILAFFTWRGSLTMVSLPGTAFFSALQKTFERGSPQAFVVYGLSYGMVSLTCSLPVFMVVVGEGLMRDWTTEILLFGAYALGIATVVVGLSTITAVARSVVERLIQQIMPMIQKASAVLIFGAALYLAGYWLLGPGFSTVFP